MPAPAFRSSTANKTGTFNSFPIAKPAGVIDGDLLIVALETYDASGSMAHGTPPVGWTLIRSLNVTTGPIRASVYRKIAASEPSSWTFTKTNDSSGFGGCIGCIAISDPGIPATPLADEQGALDTSGTTLITAPSVNAATASDLLVYVGASRGAPTWTPPTGFTEHVDINETGQSQCLTIASKTAGTIGATGSVSATKSAGTQPGAGFLLAVAAPPPAIVPVADFTGTPLTGIVPLNVAFTDASTNTPTSWAWTFGDGATSTSQNPTHSYTTSGVYTVALTATNASGSNTKTRTAYVTASEASTLVSGGGINIY